MEGVKNVSFTLRLDVEEMEEIEEMDKKEEMEEIKEIEEMEEKEEMEKRKNGRIGKKEEMEEKDEKDEMEELEEMMSKGEFFEGKCGGSEQSIMYQQALALLPPTSQVHLGKTWRRKNNSQIHSLKKYCNKAHKGGGRHTLHLYHATDNAEMLMFDVPVLIVPNTPPKI